MKTLSLKLDDAIFKDTEDILKNLKKPRNRYINEAIDYYNNLQRRRMMYQKIKEESNMVRDESMSVLKEFESIDYEN